MNGFKKDWLERVLWTAAQAVLGVVAVEVADLNLAWAPVVAVAVAALKGVVARKVGDPESAATLPVSGGGAHVAD